jgi:hypothetical protein
MKKIAIYNENCTMSGKQCHTVEITDDGLAINPTTERENGDVTVYEVSDAEIERLEKLRDQAGAGSDLFYLRVANTLREFLKRHLVGDRTE